MADLSQEVGVLPGGGHPWGNIYNVQAPEVDKLGERLWQTERLNAVNGNKAAKGLKKQMDDEEFKTSAAIRGADVPDYVNAYSAYKNAQMDFDKNSAGMSLQDRVNAQNNVNNLFSTATKLGNDSKTRKAWELQTGKDILNPANRNTYADNAGDLMTSSINTPLAKLNTVSTTGSDGKQTTIDLTNPKSFQYQSSTDFQPYFDMAKGKTPIQLNDVDVSIPESADRMINRYKGFASPQNFYNSLLNNVGSDNTKTKVSAGKSLKDFQATYGNISDDDYATTEAKFNQLVNDPTYQSIYGKEVANPFPASADNTQTGKIAKYLTMKYALDNQPKLSETVKPNDDNRIAKQQLFQRQMQDARFKNQWDLFRKQEDYKAGEVVNSVQAVVDDQVKNGTPKRDATTGTPTGDIILPVIQPIRDALAKDTPVYDSEAKDDQGNPVSGVPKLDPTTGKPLMQKVPVIQVTKMKDGRYDVQYSDGGHTLMTEDGYKGVITASKAYDTKTKIQQIDTKPTINTGGGSAHSSTTIKTSSGQPSTSPVPATTTYKIKGKTYSHADLNKLGYTDDQISQGKKLGNIK